MDDKCCEWCGTTASHDADKCPICRQRFDLVIGPPAGSKVMVPQTRVPQSGGAGSSTDVLDKPHLGADAPLADDFADAGDAQGTTSVPTPRAPLSDSDLPVIDRIPDDGIDPTLRALATHLDAREARRRIPRTRSSKKQQHHQRRRRGVRLAIGGGVGVVVLAAAVIGGRELLPSDRVADTVRAYYGADTCSEAIDQVSSDSAPIFRVCEENVSGREISDIEVSEVEVDGDEATAQVRLRETVDGTSRIQSFEQQLVKEDGDWRLLLTIDG